MNPLLLLSLFNMAPGILSSLGLMGGDPRQKLQQQLLQLMSPGNVGKLTQQFTQQAMQNPAYSAAQGGIAAGANATQGKLASSLGARGLGTSGTGAVLSSLTPSIVGQQQSQLNSAAAQQGQQMAQNSIEGQMRALMGTGGLPSQTQQYFAGGLEAMQPLLMQFLKSQGGDMSKLLAFLGNQ
jgi:hypothetical protein